LRDGVQENGARAAEQKVSQAQHWQGFPRKPLWL